MNTDNVVRFQNIYRTNIAEIAYFLYFTVMFGARAIGLFEGMLVYNISLVIGMLLFAVKVALTNHTILEYLVIFWLLLISFLVYVNTGEKGLLLYFTMMLGLKGVSVKKVFKLGTVILTVSFVTLVFLSVTGIREEITYIHDRAGFGHVIRHSLGYPYPNTLMTTYIVLMALVFYVMGKTSRKNILLTTLLFLMGIIYLYLYSCSNTGLLVGVFFLIVNLYIQFRGSLSKFEKAVIWLVYPICVITSVVGPLVTKGWLFQLFDKVLHNRWAYSLYYLTNEPITLFGVRFKEAPNPNYMIDSSFLYCFLQIGIVPFAIITFLYLGMITDCVKKEKKAEQIIIVSFCVLGLSDPFLFNLSYKNLMFLFVGDFLYQRFEELRKRNLGLWNREIQLIPAGSREISFDIGILGIACTIGRRVREEITKRIGIWCSLYFLMLTMITAGLYSTFHRNYIIGAVDDIPEWEFIRSVVSIGVFGAALAVGVLLTVKLIRVYKKE